MIISFGNKTTADLFNGINSREARKIPSEIMKKALNKLDILNAVETLDELKSPPGNRLEALKGNLKGFYSIRLTTPLPKGERILGLNTASTNKR